MYTFAGEFAQQQSEEERNERFLKRYLQYTRSHCFPRLSPEAAQHLQAEYVNIRKQVSNTPCVRFGLSRLRSDE